MTDKYVKFIKSVSPTPPPPSSEQTLTRTPFEHWLGLRVEQGRLHVFLSGSFRLLATKA